MNKADDKNKEIIIKKKESSKEKDERRMMIKAEKEKLKNKINNLETDDLASYKQTYSLLKDEYYDAVDTINKHIKLSLPERLKNLASRKLSRVYDKLKIKWEGLKEKHPTLAQFTAFFVFSNGVTLLQMILMPLIKHWFEQTRLVMINFQVGQIGQEVSGDPYYMFNYPDGFISEGGGGGLAYFLAVQLTLLVAQIVNFFLQRNITFKSKTSIYKAAFWYFIAYLMITLIASASLVLYKAPIYTFFIETLSLGQTGETFADAITMIIYSAISFWVFFPIFKLIFKNPIEEEETN